MILLRGVHFTHVQCYWGSNLQMEFSPKNLLYMRPIHVWHSRMPDGVWCAHFPRDITTIMYQIQWLYALKASKLTKRALNATYQSEQYYIFMVVSVHHTHMYSMLFLLQCQAFKQYKIVKVIKWSGNQKSLNKNCTSRTRWPSCTVTGCKNDSGRNRYVRPYTVE
jgi:hypothetical protein